MFELGLQDGQKEYFIDVDPELFEHILRFLRTGTYPLFYNRDTGFDIARYMALLSQAKLLQIDTLSSWIEKKTYLKAVWIKTRFVSTTVYGEEQLSVLQEKSWSNREKPRSFSLHQSDSRVWSCPKDNFTHHGSRDACVRANCIGHTRAQAGDVVLMSKYKVESVVESLEYRSEVLQARQVPEVPPPYIDGSSMLEPATRR